MQEKETPIYNKFKEIFKRANENYKGDDPAKLYAVIFERFVNNLIEKEK